jgi:flagellin
MDVNSINTNAAALIALQVLDSTNEALNGVQKQISTGYRVADATDDGASYAIAQRVRSDESALNSANEQMGGVSGLLSTTLSGLNDVSNTLNSARDVLVSLANDSVTGTERTQDWTQFQSLTTEIKTYLNEATYNNKTLIGNIGQTAGYASVSVVQDELGDRYQIKSANGSSLYNPLTAAGLSGGASASAALTATGAMTTALNTVGTYLAQFGANQNYVQNQVSYNSDKVSALTDGLGALVDADMTAESALLTSLQTKQQLATQALTMAEQAPNNLLTLFKNG